MLLNLFYALIGYFIGMFISTIGISQILCCLFCAIPVTARMKHSKEPAEYGKIYAKISICLIFWTFITYLVFILMKHFAPTFMKSCALVSTCFFSFFALSKCGMNSSNLEEYVIAYGRYYMNISDENFSIEKAKHTRYCKYCGSLIDDDKKCTGCGKQYFRFPHLRNLKFSHIMCISLFLFLSYYCYSEAITIIKMTNKIQNLEETLEISESNYSELKNQYTKLETDYTELNNEYKITKTNCEHYKEQVTKYSEYRDTAYYWNQYGALTIPNNNRYHTHSCKRLRYAETIYVWNVWDAESQGYTPCPDCH